MASYQWPPIVSSGVTSLNSITGAVTLVAGTGITVTPAGQNITIASTSQPAGNYITALTGDGTAAGPGSAGLTLSTVNSNVGSFGSVTDAAIFTVNAKGLITAASSSSIQIAESQVTNLVSDLAGKQASGNYLTALTGDATAAGPGSSALTLATVNSNVGSFGGATAVSAITVNAKGLVTAAASTSIQIAESQVTNLVSDLAGKQAAGNYITALTGDVTAAGPGSSAAALAATQANIATLSLATGVAVHGSNTNDSAAAGYVGEYVESLVTTATNYATSGQYGDLTSISLTAGDWDVTLFQVAKANGAAVTDVSSGIGTATGNSSAGLIEGVNTVLSGFFPTAGNVMFFSIPSFRVSLSATTTIYAKGLASYTVATPQFKCRLSARRVR